jgi:hypothetical protein
MQIAAQTIPDPDIWKTALSLLDRHGDNAPMFASIKAKVLELEGDDEGCAVWTQICGVIEDLMWKTPEPPEYPH